MNELCVKYRHRLFTYNHGAPQKGKKSATNITGEIREILSKIGCKISLKKQKTNISPREPQPTKSSEERKVERQLYSVPVLFYQLPHQSKFCLC